MYDYIQGAQGPQGYTPAIGINGNWFINGVDTTKPSTGADGNTPYIQTGTWWIDGVDTGQAAQGIQGVPGETTLETAYRENITAQVDGVTAEFTLSVEPMDIDSIFVFSNGTNQPVIQLVGAAITLDFVPEAGTTLYCYYKTNTTSIPSLTNKVDKPMEKS